MIAFTTLFLGLVVGLQQVEVAVGDGVVAVEILLDNHSVGTVTAEPWILAVDFGSELAPHFLEAVAYDAERKEIDRVRQLINLPQPPAAVSFVVDTDADTGSSVARLAWESRVGESPRSVSAWLDGQPLVVEDPRRIVLPPHDPTQLHLFTADLEFTDSITSQVMATFGGTFVDQVQTELTALPVVFAGKKRKKPPSIKSMRGWFLKQGKSLEPSAIEKGRSEIIFVLGAPVESEGLGSGYQDSVPLKSGQSVRFLQPMARPSPGVEATFDLFPISPEYDRRDGGLYWLLTGLNLQAQMEGQRRLADAVAVAGLSAYERSRRRAVVLVTDNSPRNSVRMEASQVSPEQSRRYLEHLQVPFYVWTGRIKAAKLEGWGQTTSVSSVGKFGAAFDKLNKELDQQWIVWFEGRHLPRDITLSDRAEGISLIRH